MTKRLKTVQRSARLLLLLGFISGGVAAAVGGAMLGANLKVQEAELREGVAPQIVIGGIRS